MIKKILITFSALLIGGCSTNKGAPAASNSPEASANGTEIEGVWRSGCTVPSGSNDYQRTTFTTSQNGFTQTTINYATDFNCANAQFTVYASGSFALEATPILNPPDAKSIDSLATVLMLTPNSGAVATSFNNASYCGVTNWTAGLSVNLIGLVCDGKTYPADGYRDYNIYRLVGTILTFGDETGANDGSEPAKRPTSYDSASLVKL